MHVRKMRVMHFMLLIGIVSVIRVDLVCLSFQLGPIFPGSPRTRENTLLQEGLAAKSIKTRRNGSFLSYR